MKRKQSSGTHYLPEEMHISKSYPRNNQSLAPHRAYLTRPIPSVSYQDIHVQQFIHAGPQSNIELEDTNLSRTEMTPRRLKLKSKYIQRPAAEFHADEIELQQCQQLSKTACFGPEKMYEYKPQLPRRGGISSDSDSRPGSRNLDQQFLRNDDISKARNIGFNSQLRRHNTMGCIKDMTQTEASEYYTSMGTTDLRMSQKDFLKPNNGLSNTGMTMNEAIYEVPDVTEVEAESTNSETETTQSETDIKENHPLKHKCQSCIFLFLIVFVASIAGAGLYSIIGCALSKCK